MKDYFGTLAGADDDDDDDDQNSRSDADDAAKPALVPFSERSLCDQHIGHNSIDHSYV